MGCSARPADDVVLFDFAIAGNWYHGLRDVRDALRVGETLTLRPEPDTVHDANAVAVRRVDGFTLGYVPRAANEPVAALLARGAQVEAVVIEKLTIDRFAPVPHDLVFTGFTDGDPRVRLTMIG